MLNPRLLLLNVIATECVLILICLFLHFPPPYFPLLPFPFFPFGQSIAPLPFGHCSRRRPLIHRPNHNLLSIGHLCIIDGSLAHSFPFSLILFLVPSTATMCSYITAGITAEQSFHYYCGNHCTLQSTMVTCTTTTTTIK